MVVGFAKYQGHWFFDPMRQTMKKAARKTTATRVKKSRATVKFLEKPTCATCRKAKRFLQKRGYKLNYRDITKDPLSVSELEKLIGTHDHEDFLRPRSSIFQRKNMKDNPPGRREAIRMMAKNPDLIRRPVVVAGGRVVIGYDENGMIRF
jgi:Spx/MgsR family transcriptional regulator